MGQNKGDTIKMKFQGIAQSIKLQMAKLFFLKHLAWIPSLNMITIISGHMIYMCVLKFQEKRLYTTISYMDRLFLVAQ